MTSEASVRQEQSGRATRATSEGRALRDEPGAVSVDGCESRPEATVVHVDEWKVIATYDGKRYQMRFDHPYPNSYTWQPGPPLEITRALDAAWMAFKEPKR